MHRAETADFDESEHHEKRLTDRYPTLTPISMAIAPLSLSLVATLLKHMRVLTIDRTMQMQMHVCQHGDGMQLNRSGRRSALTTPTRQGVEKPDRTNKELGMQH